MCSKLFMRHLVEKGFKKLNPQGWLFHLVSIPLKRGTPTEWVGASVLKIPFLYKYHLSEENGGYGAVSPLPQKSGQTKKVNKGIFCQKLGFPPFVGVLGWGYRLPDPPFSFLKNMFMQERLVCLTHTIF